MVVFNADGPHDDSFGSHEGLQVVSDHFGLPFGARKFVSPQWEAEGVSFPGSLVHQLWELFFGIAHVVSTTPEVLSVVVFKVPIFQGGFSDDFFHHAQSHISVLGEEFALVYESVTGGLDRK